MIGEKIGPYTILEIVGAGSIGTVYKAEDAVGRPVAIKVVRSDVLNTPEKRERFLQNALVASETRLPCICPILEIGDDNNDLFVITPFLDGKTLAQHASGKPMPWPQALSIALAAGSALGTVHQSRAVHGYLKPSNIWIFDRGGPDLLLTDCCVGYPAGSPRYAGIRRIPPSADFEIPAEAFAYMSPEQLLGEPIDHRADIFSFAVILHELLSGRHPFEAADAEACIGRILRSQADALPALHPPVPAHLQPIILRALEKKPGDRFPSMRIMLMELRSVSAKQARTKNAAVLGKRIATRFLSRLRNKALLH